MKEQLKEIINEILEKKEGNLIETLDEDLSLRKDLGFDSLDLAELTVVIQDKFGVDIFEEDIVDKVSEIVEIIQKKGC
ncbi:MAG: acyl carrier protein [Clostridia bacterium]|nr:acyl carrier protein [Clostridia bacterium]